MVESALWHPVALAGDVANTPLAVQLLDQPLVLWRDGLGGVQALADRCPHRGARLSLGRVTVQGRLEGPYHGWQCSRDVPAIDDYRVEATTTGLLATGCKAWQPQSNLHSTAPAQVEYTYEVTAPYAAVLTKVPEAGTTAVDGWRESIALFICPITPVRSRVWFRLAVADFDSPDEKLQAFQHTIFTQDQPVLESQTPQCLPLDLRAELHTAADKASSAYRRFLRQSGITFGVC